MREGGFVATLRYALNGVDLLAPVRHVALLELRIDDDLDLVPLGDARLRVVGLSDALQLRLYFRLVVFLLRVLRRHQRVAADVVLVVVFHHGVDYFPPPLVRASNGMDDMVLFLYVQSSSPRRARV